MADCYHGSQFHSYALSWIAPICWQDISSDKKLSSDGAIIGAIPSALLANTATLKQLGIASVESHMRTRMKNSALLTSTDDAYLCYAFDTVLNLVVNMLTPE